MKRLRSVLFWCHLAMGTSAGIVILIMSATGAALALKPQILNAIERRVRAVAPSNGPRLSVSQAIAAVRAERPQASVQSLTIDRDPSRAIAVALERGVVVYLNPYSGAVLGEGSASAQAFFRTLENWHRWLGVSTENRATARSITGAANVAFLALGVSGLYLWWPRRWSAQHTRAILAFRRTATGRARDFNWHNVIGFWCAPIIIVMTTTGLVMSYPRANDLLYRIMGSELPSAAAEPRPPAGAAGDQRRDALVQAEPLGATQLDRAWERAEALMPSWRVVTFRLPTRPELPIAFTITDGDSWNAFARSQLTVDGASGDVRRWQPYDSSSPGQKARGWFRFGHTGELAGIGGQVVAGVACVGGVVLVWTGLALAFRRFLGWRPWARASAARPADSGRAIDGGAAV